MAVTESTLIVGPLVPAEGVTTISLDYFFEQEEWLDVYQGDASDPLVLNTDYTVTGEGTTTGVVTLTTPADGVDAYSVVLTVPMQRSSDLSFRGGFSSEPFNLELDRVWQAMQGLRTRVDRSLSVGQTEDALPLFLRDESATDSRVLQFNEDSTAVIPGVSVSDIESAADNAALAQAAADSAAAQAALTAVALGAVGDGVTNDTQAFTDIEAVTTGRVVDLSGRTYLVDSEPKGNFYVNGKWIISSVTYPSLDSATTISADYPQYTTGDLDDPSTAGTLVNPSSGGRTTDHQIVLMGSRKSKASFVRAGVFVSNESEARGNGSMVGASRLTIVEGNSAAAFACEEVIAAGRKSFGAGSIRAFMPGEFSAAIVSKDIEITTSGTQVGYNAVIGGTNVYIGEGYGFDFDYEINASGTIENMVLLSGGVGYASDTTLVIETLGGLGSGAAGTVTVDGSGTITALTLTSGGSGYVPGDTRIYLESGDASYNVAIGVTGVSTMSGSVAAIAGTRQGRVSGTRNFLGGCDDFDVTSDSAGALFATLGTVSGEQSAAMTGSQIEVTGAQSMGVCSRRIVVAGNRVLAMGNASSGSASSANRKIQLDADTGNISAAGTITGSTVFADYAYMLKNESVGAIPLGTLVTMDGEEVRPSVAGDEIAGAITAHALIVAGDSPFEWGGRFLTGEFDEQLLEEIPDPDWPPFIEDPEWEATIPNPLHPEYEETRVTNSEGVVEVHEALLSEARIPNPTPADMIPNPAPQGTIMAPIENPEYDPDQPNVPRSSRPDDWSKVGIMGKLHIRCDQSVEKNSYIASDDLARATASDTKTRIRCMKITTPYDETKGYGVALCFRS